MKKLILLAGISASTLIHAAAMPVMPSSPWSFSGAVGYSNSSNMVSNDGQSPSLRLALGRAFAKTHGVKIGAELGVQTGSQMRLDMSTENYNNLGGVAVQTNIAPMIDLLLTTRRKLIDSSNVSVYVKGGIAYRSMHFDRDTVNTLRKVNREIQVGVSMPISSNACLSMGYQGVLAGSMNLTTTTEGNGTVSNLPSVHGALMSVTYRA